MYEGENISEDPNFSADTPENAGTIKSSLSKPANSEIAEGDIVTIDYALTDIGDLSIAQYSHVFSLKVGLNSFKRKPKVAE